MTLLDAILDLAAITIFRFSANTSASSIQTTANM